MAKRVALIGGGGHALSLLDILPSTADVAGYVDMHPSPGMPAAYLGDDEAFMASCGPDGWDVVITVVSGADCSLAARRGIIGRYSLYGSPAVVASTAVVSPSASIGGGTAVFHRAVIGASARMGCHCVVNTGAVVEHGCRMGCNVFIGPGAVICGGVSVGDDAYIGAGAVVRPGVRICAGCVVGAGAVVIRDIDSAGTYAGVPAKKIKG